jgi:hypothetical protein
MSKISPNRYEGMSLRKLCARANADTDPVSIFMLGDKLEEYTGAIIIVKGGANAFKARNILANAGMVDINKPV